MLQPPIDDKPKQSHQAGSSADPDALAAALQGAKRNRFRAGLIFGTIVTIAAVLLIAQNGESAQLDWIAFHFRMPLWILLILTAAAGAIVWELIKVGWRHGRRQRRDQKNAVASARASLTSSKS
ncbi:MAG: LapA family protein [Ilumatobacteraceae bacterium]